MKNSFFWDVSPCVSCLNWHIGGKYRLHLQERKKQQLAITSKLKEKAEFVAVHCWHCHSVAQQLLDIKCLCNARFFFECNGSNLKNGNETTEKNTTLQPRSWKTQKWENMVKDSTVERAVSSAANPCVCEVAQNLQLLFLGEPSIDHTTQSPQILKLSKISMVM
jgi:hypothetical protein